jgi:hypothetical protein
VDHGLDEARHARSCQDRSTDSTEAKLVGAGVLDVSWLLAAVADTLVGSLRRAVPRQVADFTAVVALLALGAVAAHVPEATA